MNVIFVTQNNFKTVQEYPTVSLDFTLLLTVTYKFSADTHAEQKNKLHEQEQPNRQSHTACATPF